MGLLELIKMIGEDNIKVQAVNSSVVNVKDKKRTNDTEITIATNELSANDVMTNNGKVGLIVWISRNDYNKHLN